MMGKVNLQVNSVAVPLGSTGEIARVKIPAGIERIGMAVDNDGANAFDAFEVRAKIGDKEVTLASATADYTTPSDPIVNSDRGDLTGLAASSGGWLLIDCRGFSEIAFFASAAVGASTATLYITD